MKRKLTKDSKLTKRQISEIKCLEHFGLSKIDYANSKALFEDGIVAKEGDVPADIAYFQITDDGAKEVFVNDINRLRFLLDAQKWRLRMRDMYEEDILSGSICYATILEDVDSHVVNFLARSMFSGKDNELIRYYYKHKSLIGFINKN